MSPRTRACSQPCAYALAQRPRDRCGIALHVPSHMIDRRLQASISCQGDAIKPHALLRWPLENAETHLQVRFTFLVQ